MSPDLLYFLLLDTEHRGISHSWLGLFTFCLPAGILFSFAFHRLFKYHVILNLPRPVDRWLSGLAYSRFEINSLRKWSVLVISVLAGAISHFFWDSFTHTEGEIARLFPILIQESTILGITRPICTFLQHLSTISGAILILLYAAKSNLLPKPAFEEAVINPKNKLLFWISGLGIASIFAMVAVIFQGVYSWYYVDEFSRMTHIFKTFGLASWAGFFYFACAYSLIMKVRGIESELSDPFG